MISYAKMRLLAVLMIYLPFAATSSAQVSPELGQKAQNASELAAIATQNGYVRVIAQFSGPLPANQIRPDAQSLATVKGQIASIQEAIITLHFGSVTNPRPGSGFSRNLVRFDISPMFAINVSAAELSALAADPRVTLIHLDRAQPPTLNQSVPLIGMPAAYAANATGLGQAVAILDTGVQSRHEFLRNNIIQEACFSAAANEINVVSLCPNGQTMEVGVRAADTITRSCINRSSSLCQHGTHVAGIAAGIISGPSGVNPPNGVALHAKIIAVQVFSRFNDAAACGGNPPCVLTPISDQIRALEWIFENALVPEPGVKLAAVNMSLGGGMFTGACDQEPQKPIIDTLRNAGVATIIAAGNDGFTGAIGSPACISTAIAVGSSDKHDIISSFSNMSPLVKLMAPGGFGFELPDGSPLPCVAGSFNENILSSVSSTSVFRTNLYDCFNGTSMAAPHVAGAFAAIRTVCPNATIDQIVAALQQTGVAIADTRSGGTRTVPRISVDLARRALGCVMAAR